MNLPAIPLLVAKDIEQQRSWEGISTPYDLAIFFSKILSVDPNKVGVFNEIVYSNLQPTGDDAKKLWIKTEEPVGFGIPTATGYSIIYQYPPNTPILWTKGKENIPEYMRELTADEMDDYGLTEPGKTAIVWVIFNL